MTWTPFLYSILLFVCVGETKPSILSENSLEYLEQLKQIRNTVLEEWEHPGETLSTPRPWQPPDKESTPVQLVEVPTKEKANQVHDPPKEEDYTTPRTVVKNEIHPGDGETFSAFPLVIIAFLPAFTAILVCGTLVVAIFAKAKQKDSPEQKARRKIDAWGIFEGVGGGDIPVPPTTVVSQPFRGGQVPVVYNGELVGRDVETGRMTRGVEERGLRKKPWRGKGKGKGQRPLRTSVLKRNRPKIKGRRK